MINFFSENVDYQINNSGDVKVWVAKSVENEAASLGFLNVVFCSDEYLLNINKQYLHHDYYTDIITFNHSEGKSLEGDIFISVERAAENAEKFTTDLDSEIKRLIIHGTLHLLGYDDRSAEDKKLMTSKEDYYLSLWT